MDAVGGHYRPVDANGNSAPRSRDDQVALDEVRARPYGAGGGSMSVSQRRLGAADLRMESALLIPSSQRRLGSMSVFTGDGPSIRTPSTAARDMDPSLRWGDGWDAGSA